VSSYICSTCGYYGRVNRKLKGSSQAELLIWMLLIIPGPFYSFWRRTGVTSTCPNCRKTTVLSIKSVEGFELLKKQEEDLANGREALIPQNYKPEIDVNEFIENKVNLQNESSFKGCIVQRDLKQELLELSEDKKTKEKKEKEYIENNNDF